MSLTKRRPRIAAVGDNCIDILLPPIGRRLVGGNAVNVAVQLARLGAEVSYYGAVGKDDQGGQVASALIGNGVGVDHLVQRPMVTSHTVISVDADGDRHMDFEDFGACDGYAPDAAAFGELLSMDHVHIGWLNDGGDLRRRLAGASVSVSQDVSVNADPRHLGVDGLTVVFASCRGDHGQAAVQAADLLARGARNAVVTRGAAGSSIFWAGSAFERPAEPVIPLDTTGAGDSFAAGFMFGILTGQSVRDASDLAARAASATCLHLGGFPQ
ncbi:PfkB family carbohydrate kinase [Mesorhizobium sp. NZP2298]|uniref:PfkB family carbohydrate kinase n=1 Tax=Mesorhizobium sp. NZP2298 TaxID=2483403 RepID=UPI001556AC18|nr:PfkB family carbohydrate kinase [Mesorhizobium sp. NZP2298]QKC98222.1 fructoselysine 6-kinase [Mesorhizobium sp. NZP2298]